MIEWNDYWKDYKPSKAEKWLISQRNKIIGDYLDKIDASEKSVLEVGCGYGSNLKLINGSRNDVTCYGLDNSIEAVRAVKTVIPFAVVSDCRSAAFQDKKFDLIYSSGLMEHFNDEIPFLSEMWRILKDDGYLITIVPARYSLWKLYQLMHFGLWQHGYEKAYTYQGLLLLFERNGFHVLQIKGIDPFSLSGFLMKLLNRSFDPIFERAPQKSAYTELCAVTRKKDDRGGKREERNGETGIGD